MTEMTSQDILISARFCGLLSKGVQGFVVLEWGTAEGDELVRPLTF